MKKKYITPCTETLVLKMETALLGDSTYSSGQSVDAVYDDDVTTDDDGWIINNAKHGLFFDDEEF